MNLEERSRYTFQLLVHAKKDHLLVNIAQLRCICHSFLSSLASLAASLATSFTFALPFLGFMKQKHEQHGHWNKNFIAFAFPHTFKLFQNTLAINFFYFLEVQLYSLFLSSFLSNNVVHFLTFINPSDSISVSINTERCFRNNASFLV